MLTVASPIGSRPLQSVYSTIDAVEIQRVIEDHYPVGSIAECALLQCGFNDVYEVKTSEGRRCIARLSSRLERGVPNVDYETSLLKHLQTEGAAVAAPWSTKHHSLFVNLSASEGERSLVVFDYLEGDGPKGVHDNIAAMGGELARIHKLSRTYHGPASVYKLDLDHLLRRPLQRILSLSVIDAELRELIVSLAADIEVKAAGFDNLLMVGCHGDCHGGNTIMTKGPNGSSIASFFDFDDGGPGFQAYDLAVYLWGGLLGMALAEPDDELLGKWKAFLGGYREVFPVSDVDMSAIPAFLTIRHFWLMGEYASRAQRMGLSIFRSSWFRKRFNLAQGWHSLNIVVP